MTSGYRPAGTTSRGLPYPGSDTTHAGTPAALQALAEAIEPALASGIGAGIAFDFYAGGALVASTGDITVDMAWFPRLTALNGMVATQGTNMGGPFRWAWTAVSTDTIIRLIASEPGAAAPSGWMTINIIAWGPAR